jgi:hypothetical protein
MNKKPWASYFISKLFSIIKLNLSIDELEKLNI